MSYFRAISFPDPASNPGSHIAFIVHIFLVFINPD